MNAAQNKRRSRRRLSARLRTYWVLVAIALGGLILGGWWLASAPMFRLKSLTVGDVPRVSRETVIARAALDPRGNVWLLNRGAIERRIEAIPYVATARVHVRFPASVRIDVTQRQPTACVRDAVGERFTIDAASRVLESGCTGAALPTYVLRERLHAVSGTFLNDSELARLESDAQVLGTIGRYRRLSDDAYGQLVATNAAGIDVRFGDKRDLGRQARLLAPILAQLGRRAADVRAVDLRAPSTPVVEYRH